MSKKDILTKERSPTGSGQIGEQHHIMSEAGGAGSLSKNWHVDSVLRFIAYPPNIMENAGKKVSCGPILDPQGRIS